MYGCKETPLQIAKSDHEILTCFPVLKELRPKMDEASFLTTIRYMQTEGYVLAYIKTGDVVVAVAGFRICMNLAAEGNALYVYDLVTSETERSKGHGAKMLEGVVAYAKNANCNCVHLDSNVVRHKAHKFYLENGFDIVAHHFLLRLK